MSAVTVILHTTGGEIVGKISPNATEDEVTQLREGLKELVGPNLNYLDLDTDNGFVVVPGNQLLYIEARVS